MQSDDALLELLRKLQLMELTVKVLEVLIIFI